MKAVSHAAVRLEERYGISMQKSEMAALYRRLINGEGVLLEKHAHENGIQRRLINVKGQDVVALWDPIRHFLISIFPRKKLLPKIHRPNRKRKGKSGRTRREGKRPEQEAEYE